MTRNKPKDSQVFLELYRGECTIDDLTEHQRERLNRIKSIHAADLAYKNTQEIINIMNDLYGISQAQVYRDIKIAALVIGDANMSNKEMDRIIGKNMAKDAFKMALEKGDIRGMNGAGKNWNDASGIKNADVDLPDFSKLNQSVYVEHLSKKSEAFIEKFLESGGAVNLSKFLNEQAENAEFEDINGGSDQSKD